MKTLVSSNTLQWNSEVLIIYSLWQRKQLFIQRHKNLSEFMRYMNFINKKLCFFRFDGALKAYQWKIYIKSLNLTFILIKLFTAKQLSVSFNKLHKFKMVIKRHVQKTTKDSQLFCYTFFKSVLYLASSDPKCSSSRIAAALRLDVWCWTTGLKMVKEDAKKYFNNLYFMERMDWLKALN